LTQLPVLLECYLVIPSPAAGNREILKAVLREATITRRAGSSLGGEGEGKRNKRYGKSGRQPTGTLVNRWMDALVQTSTDR
jgi:hypothetical protein